MSYKSENIKRMEDINLRTRVQKQVVDDINSHVKKHSFFFETFKTNEIIELELKLFRVILGSDYFTQNTEHVNKNLDLEWIWLISSDQQLFAINMRKNWNKWNVYPDFSSYEGWFKREYKIMLNGSNQVIIDIDII